MSEEADALELLHQTVKRQEEQLDAQEKIIAALQNGSVGESDIAHQPESEPADQLETEDVADNAAAADNAAEPRDEGNLGDASVDAHAV